MGRFLEGETDPDMEDLGADNLGDALVDQTARLRLVEIVTDAPCWVIESVGARPDDPLVLVLHGLGSRKERHLQMGLELAAHGYRVCLPDAPFHGERRDSEMAAHLSDFRQPGFADAFETLVEAQTLEVQWLATVLAPDRRFGMIGHSMGGFVGLQCALRIDACQSLAVISGAIDPLHPPSAIEYGDQLTARLEALCVRSRAESLGHCAICLLHGTDDTLVPFGGAARLFDALIQPSNPPAARRDLLRYPTGHDMVPAMRDDAIAWICETFPPRA